ncbi:DUF6745 domain-containing protein [Solihabitans fulvus]|uniref:DUF6745 domain-containing protein n=1 Tax=Solihabitans fulvus TaxID=1892852 RepID=UPI001661C420|nr:hypothetical protein [Solihabitans fulvus]
MSARRGRKSRSSAVLNQFARDLDLWAHAVELRTEWLGHALCGVPADRAATEGAITDLYARVDHPPPAFVWVESPSAALRELPPSPHVLSSHGPWPLENRLASLVSALRHRLEGHRWTNRDSSFLSSQPPQDPVAALRSGDTLKSIVDHGVRGALRRTVRDSVAGVMRAALPDRLGMFWYGQQEADWVAYHDVRRRVAGARVNPADAAELELWATLARSCGWWWPRADVCVIAERPLAVRTEPVPDAVYGEARMHNATGPSVVFPDGWAVHSWHGTRVPSWVIDGPTVELIAAERNVEVRRCAIERIGWESYIELARLRLVGRSSDPGNPGCELHLYDLPYAQRGASVRLLLAVNGSVERDGTRRRYGLHVPSWFDDPIDAAGWSYGLTGAQYALLQRRT